YNIAKRIVQNRMFFMFHCSIYLTVVGLLVLINVMNFEGLWWSFWPAWFWGIMLVSNYLYAYILVDVFSKNPMQSERFERKALFWMHLLVFLLTNGTFVFINIMYSPQIIWSVYPLCGWGIGLFYHFFFTYVFKGWKIKRWKQQKIIKLMKKYFDIEPFSEGLAGRIEKDKVSSDK
ncbi:2TM domain-containing protein, partial [bacterium]|nr:2TM domain-containing protein [bacterium]